MLNHRYYVRGKGSANYINETVDFTISTSIVGTLEGQGGKNIDELKDITIQSMCLVSGRTLNSNSYSMMFLNRKLRKLTVA